MMSVKLNLYGSPWEVCSKCGALFLVKKGHNKILCEIFSEYHRVAKEIVADYRKLTDFEKGVKE